MSLPSAFAPRPCQYCVVASAWACVQTPLVTIRVLAASMRGDLDSVELIRRDAVRRRHAE